MFNNNKIENIMTTTLNNLKNLSDVDTVIGKPIILCDNSILIPVSKVSMGFLVGGGEYDACNKKDAFPMSGGSGAGISVAPLGFLHTNGRESKFIKVNESSDNLGDLISCAINSFKKRDKNV